VADLVYPSFEPEAEGVGRKYLVRKTVSCDVLVKVSRARELHAVGFLKSASNSKQAVEMTYAMKGKDQDGVLNSRARKRPLCA
jgi:hypothetical protein